MPSIAGYPDNGPSDEQLDVIIKELMARPGYLEDRLVDTPLGKTQLPCMTLSLLQLHIRASTGRHYTNAQLTTRLNAIDVDVYQAYRGTLPMRVIVPRPHLRVVAGKDFEQTG